MKKVLSTAFALTLFIVVFAFGALTASAADSDYTYTVDGGKATITSYVGTNTKIVIPSTIAGYEVNKLSVAEGSSFSATTLTSISIPNTVSAIDANSIGYSYDGNSYIKQSSLNIFAGANSAGYTYANDNTFLYYPNYISGYTISLSTTEYTYTGLEKKPSVTIKYNGTTLSSSFYALSYSNNVNAGTGKVTINANEFLNNTTTSKTFTIAKRSISSYSVKLSTTKYTYNGQSKNPTVTVKNGSSTISNSNYTVSYSNNVNCGKAKVKVTGNGNYSGSITKYYYIYPSQITGLKFSSVDVNTATISWNKCNSVTGYKIYMYDKSSKTYKYLLTVSGADTTSYKLNNLEAGSDLSFKVRAYKTIDGTKYYGSYSSKAVAITKPVKADIVDVTKNGSSIKIKWETEKCNGYEIYYSTDKNFKKNVKKITISDNKQLKKTIKNINKKKTYYAKVRAYNTYNGKKYYGKFSSAVSSKFSHVFASYTTTYDTSVANREHNLKLACKKINGTILEPGEVFSFDAVVGRRTKEAGFKKATVFTGGNGLGTGYGGGVCQVATTLFNAALEGNLKIIEREQHSQKVSYIIAGRDAAIDWGSKNFRFQNSTKHNIKILASAKNGKVTIKYMTSEDVNPKKVKLSVSKSRSAGGTSIYTLKRTVSGKVNFTTVSNY